MWMVVVGGKKEDERIRVRYLSAVFAGRVYLHTQRSR